MKKRRGQWLKSIGGLLLLTSMCACGAPDINDDEGFLALNSEQIKRLPSLVGPSMNDQHDVLEIQENGKAYGGIRVSFTLVERDEFVRGACVLTLQRYTGALSGEPKPEGLFCGQRVLWEPPPPKGKMKRYHVEGFVAGRDPNATWDEIFVSTEQVAP